LGDFIFFLALRRNHLSWLTFGFFDIFCPTGEVEQCAGPWGTGGEWTVKRWPGDET
jgi:hypothetical protein